MVEVDEYKCRPGSLLNSRSLVDSLCSFLSPPAGLTPRSSRGQFTDVSHTQVCADFG